VTQIKFVIPSNARDLGFRVRRIGPVSERALLPAAFDFDLARVGRTLLSDAFDLAVAFDSDSETKLGRTTEACSTVEDRRFKRRVGRPTKSTRLQPPRKAGPRYPPASKCRRNLAKLALHTPA
jgi:hypothetical protein